MQTYVQCSSMRHEPSLAIPRTSRSRLQCVECQAHGLDFGQREDHGREGLLLQVAN